MFSGLSVCLFVFVCLLDYSESFEQILMKFLTGEKWKSITFQWWSGLRSGYGYPEIKRREMWRLKINPNPNPTPVITLKLIEACESIGYAWITVYSQNVLEVGAYLCCRSRSSFLCFSLSQNSSNFNTVVSWSSFWKCVTRYSPRSQLLCCLWLAGTLTGWLSDLSR